MLSQLTKLWVQTCLHPKCQKSCIYLTVLVPVTRAMTFLWTLQASLASSVCNSCSGIGIFMESRATDCSASGRKTSRVTTSTIRGEQRYRKCMYYYHCQPLNTKSTTFSTAALLCDVLNVEPYCMRMLLVQWQLKLTLKTEIYSMFGEKVVCATVSPHLYILFYTQIIWR